MKAILILVLLLGGVIATEAADGMFENKDGIYKVPIEVNEEAAVIDFGLKAVLKFAQSQQDTGKWTYAYEAELKKDPKTGKLSTKRNDGEDRLIRFFSGKQAEVIINWLPINGELVNKTKTLKQNFDVVLRKFADSYKANGESFDRTSAVGTKIGGYPAMGCKFSVLKGLHGYTTIWIIRAEDLKRMFIIRLFYSEGYADPAGDFEKVKNGIVFTKK